MRKNSTYEEKRKAGFTLVELIVVLVMLSILTAVAVPTYMGYVDDNKAKQCETHRKALASRLEEMSAMGSTASLTEDEMNSAENGCPAGGKYTLEGSGNTIHCDKHGDTTVILKSSAGIVTADVNNVQTEAPKETATPTPTPTPTPAPTPTLNLSITPNPVPTMEIGTTNQLTADPGSPKYCTVNDYEWRSDNSGIVSVGSNGETVTITAVGEGTCTIYCKAKATASAEAGGQSFDSAEVGVQVTVNEKPSLSISLAEGLASTYTLGVGATQGLNVTPTEIRCKNTSYSWSVTGGGGTAHIEGSNENATVTIKADQAGECTLVCQATAISDVDDSTVISSSNEVVVNIKVASLSISVDTSSVSDEVEIGSPISLTAMPTPRNCTVSRYNWWLENDGKGVLNITEGGTAQTVSINTQTDGSCKVYCQAFAKLDGSEQEISSNTVEIPVTVKKEETESNEGILKNKPAMLLINGQTTNLENDADLADFEAVSGGYWTSSNTGIVDMAEKNPEYQIHNKRVKPYQAGECDLIYTIEGKGSDSIHVKVVYSHNFFNVKEAPTDYNKAYVEDVRAITMIYGINGDDHKSTDGPVEWVIDTPDIIEEVAKEGENDITLKVRGKAPGVAKITARLYNEFGKYWTEVPVEYTVYIDANQLTGISAGAMQLAMNEKKKIEFSYTPWDANKNGLDYVYSGYDETLISVDGETNEVMALNKEGSTRVKVDAIKNDFVLASCEFEVTVSRLTNMWLEPGNVILSPNESQTVNIKYQPESAEISDITFELVGDYADIFEVEKNGTSLTISGKAPGDRKVTVQAKTAEGVVLREAELYVKVSRIKSITVNPTQVTFYPNEEVTVAFSVEPSDADLNGLIIELNRWDNNQPESIEVNAQDKTITLKAHEVGEWNQRLSVKENGNELVGCDIKTKVIPEGQLKDFRIEPSTIDLMQGETAQITIAPNTAGPIVIYPEPEDATLSPEQVSSNYWNVQISGGVLTAGNQNETCSVGVTVGGITKDITVRITYSKMNAAGIEFNVTAWNILKDYMKKKQNGENPSLSESNIYATGSGYYVMKKEANLEWKDEYENMTFEQFLNAGNSGSFVPVNPNSGYAPSWGSGAWAGTGTVFVKDGLYYVYIGSGMNMGQDAVWNDEDFIMITKS